MKRHGIAILASVVLAHAAAGQFTQQGSKLLGSGGSGGSALGGAVAVSADGTTAIVGGGGDNGGAGAAWVFTRVGGAWSQQGTKLVGTGAVGPAAQGQSVAISADGNTALVGGTTDNSNTGAVWVFVRSGGAWSQQGSKLVAADAAGAPMLGFSAAVSADGNTAIFGGPTDHSGLGAAFVFTRSGGVWTQQGSKLVGSGAVQVAEEGHAVALSGDGNTALIGGFADNSSVGAAWVFTRNAGVWTQQGGKLVGSDVVGAAAQGSSVALSADGGTALVGGNQDALDTGAVWVFSRSRILGWVQQGSKLVGTGANASAGQGRAVALSGDGNTAIVGGADEYPTGAAWVFTRAAGAWSQLGSKLVGSGASGDARQGTAVALSSDGSTAVVGGPSDASSSGAAWVFTAPTFSAWVPVASHNPGKNNSTWRSDLGLLNTGATTANVQIKFFGSGGVVTGTTSVAAGAQSILADVVGQVGGANSGAIEILSDEPLKVTARSYNLVSSGSACYANGTQGQNYPVVASADGLGAGESAFLGGLTENAVYRCNIGLVNTGAGSASVLVELFDGAGSKLASYAVTLAAGQWAQETQPFLSKAAQTALDRGYAKITVQSGDGVFAFASVIDNLTTDPTTVTMQR